MCEIPELIQEADAQRPDLHHEGHPWMIRPVANAMTESAYFKSLKQVLSIKFIKI